VTEPQLGQKNLTAFSLGTMILLQEMQVGNDYTPYFQASGSERD